MSIFLGLCKTTKSTAETSSLPRVIGILLGRAFSIAKKLNKKLT
jgi:hypothetical protein